MYHSIEDSTWKYGVSPDMLRRQMKYLRSHFTILPLGEVIRYARGERSISDKTIAITFDDGYRGVYEHMLPEAHRNNMPFTVFLTTNLTCTEALGNVPRLSAAQVRELSETDIVSIEAHGHEHQNLAELHARGVDIAADLRTCSETIYAFTNKYPRFFAYPSGHRSPSVTGIVKSMFEAACGITEGCIKPGDNIYALKRVQIDRTMDMVQFRLRLGGGLDIHRLLVDQIRHIVRL
jgi:peptidoglycan/xylan/chitin deacetylase (PgdA/CDA1 family)